MRTASRLIISALAIAVLPAGAETRDFQSVDPRSELDGMYSASVDLCAEGPALTIDRGKITENIKFLRWPPETLIGFEKRPVQHAGLGAVDYYIIISSTKQERTLASVIFEIPNKHLDRLGLDPAEYRQQKVYAYNALLFDEVPTADEVMDRTKGGRPLETGALFLCNSSNFLS